MKPLLPAELSKSQKKSAATVLDYIVGGAVAGLAGSMSMRMPPPTTSRSTPHQPQLPTSSVLMKSGRRPLMLYGMGTGIILGVIIGVIQAGVDRLDDYVRGEEAVRKEEDFVRRIQEQ